MAIVVLVVGGLLCILGIAGYIYGLDLMPTERGVAGVISSSVIIVGGVLTLALGLILRRLEDMSKALGLTLALPEPVLERPAAPVEPAAVPDEAIALPKVVPVEAVTPAEVIEDVAPVAIEAPKPKIEAPSAGLPRFEMPRANLKPAAVVAGVAATGAVVARTGLDAVEKALSFDPPAATAPTASQPMSVPPLNLPTLKTRATPPVSESAALQPHEIEYPVEILKPADIAPSKPAVAEPVADPVPKAVETPLTYAEVPMPPAEKDPLADFEAELDRLVPLTPAAPTKATPAKRTPKLDAPEPAQQAKPDIKPGEMKTEKRKDRDDKPAEPKSAAIVEAALPPVTEPAKEAEPTLPKPAVEPAVSSFAPAPSPAPAPAAPIPAPGAEVVGAYESGGAKYTMYSDGSVIAEAEGQTMFFKSLEELREFIDGGTKM